ncbi:NAD-dependent epimerase/dehydratase family protein [Bacillus sp. FJAT-45350]|uniref:NAD-dependent epimerase/dehydratase family protein n=1 Tax=Bacillus sp. FJAT-45350 TaxID=2011014 RepID=UPI000BB8FF3E|nr:NAD-dependent epimerase/dehydratase family protein [Bacillus sp. FJAT-45350]
MTKVLITGVNSYIGKSFEQWVLQYKDKYIVDKVSLRDELWKSKSFKGYDAIIHLAAIVHVKGDEEEKYFKVNRDLTLEVAMKAKQEGVKQFIFLSTMGVYGTETGYITEDTLPAPKTKYAKSKYEAEKAIKEIEAYDFNVAIIRPPLVYGKGCPGNYARLAKMALKVPFFPDIENERSMIYIDNLSEFIRLLLGNNASGLFFPQNKEFVRITSLVNLIAKYNGKKLKKTIVFNFAIKLAISQSKTFRKVFGSLIYDKKISGGPMTVINGKMIDYETIPFEETIKKTEAMSLKGEN